ncbi:sulfite dehydrogenase (cytochrome) subunit SorA apoprotein [Ancylobacter aquaticus]|uniref:Sulfite dehydrogenase (Cytochrome) subunit SorA apoprotein n=1 Tax=Ancylobacter aquaticus TaxID=100 RepID=A0A4R1HBR0_ANCAQ|nr:molybdopterin-dependent oxidoreductase [Ancylobacter aquaticus]TCK16619.1 sulfite dehydrogenase (cytochrome) subunit SorA apoprotein [Ancylobacter aquaticus]
MFDRRHVLKTAGATALAVGLGSLSPKGMAAFAADAVTLPFANGERPLVSYPGKRPMIGLTARPPQLETPFSVFNEGVITPNDAFFVRYHLADIPLEIDPETFRLEITGTVATPLSLSLRDLKENFPASEIVAVNQCSGNSRGFMEPRVGGGQLGNGAMGNARWRGAPLKAVLEKAGVAANARQVSFAGLDGPVLPETPAFAKALDIDHARDGEVMLAYSMNGTDLPWLNGFPLRLVVPGYYGTYWVKHLNRVTVLDKEFDGFWMKSAYRIPDNGCACTEPGQAAKTTIPINRLNVRSFITNVESGAQVPAGEVALRGIAFDGGYGITSVAVSTDGGQSWSDAALGQDLGNYSFREWTAKVPLQKGAHVLMCRATDGRGQTQPMQASWNPAGYMRNVVEATRVVAV